jgi:hypothetical protein
LLDAVHRIQLRKTRMTTSHRGRVKVVRRIGTEPLPIATGRGPPGRAHSAAFTTSKLNTVPANKEPPSAPPYHVSKSTPTEKDNYIASRTDIASPAAALSPAQRRWAKRTAAAPSAANWTASRHISQPQPGKSSLHLPETAARK